jgi:hypothetical protein
LSYFLISLCHSETWVLDSITKRESLRGDGLGLNAMEQKETKN